MDFRAPAELPPELWTMILQSLRNDNLRTYFCMPAAPQHKPTLARLVRVCKVFHAIGEPLLFEYIRIKRTPAQAGHDAVSMTQFLELVKQHPKVLLWVKHLCLDFLLCDWGELQSLIPKMANIKLIRMLGCKVEAPVYVELLKLPDLEALSIGGYNDIAPEALGSFRPRLRAVSIRSPRQWPYDPVADEAPLPLLCLNHFITPHIRRLSHSSAYSVHIFRHFQTSSSAGISFDKLHEYEISDADTKTIEGFLSIARLCPNITTLTVEWNQTPCKSELAAVSALGRSHQVLPLLRTLSCPLWLASLLLPRRPVEDLNVVMRNLYTGSPTSSENVRMVVAMGSSVSANSMRRLHLSTPSWESGCLLELWEAFPSLESLGIYVPTSNVRKVG